MARHPTDRMRCAGLCPNRTAVPQGLKTRPAVVARATEHRR